MAIVDTSVWVAVLRDDTGAKRSKLSLALGDEEVLVTRFTQLELLQGARDEREWGLLGTYLDAQDYAEMSTDSWKKAARICFDLRRRGRTVRSPVDCCIAQVAMEHDQRLLHRDRDFETIALIRPLRQQWVRW